MIIRRRVRFFLHRRHAGDTKDLPLKMRVTLRGEKPFDVSTGWMIDARLWDDEREQAYGKAKEVNATIADYRRAIDEAFARFELVDKRIPTAAEIRDEFNAILGRAGAKTKEDSEKLISAFEEYIKTQSKLRQWSYQTQVSYWTIVKKLKDFSPNASINDVTDDWLYNFSEHLYAMGFKNTTVSKYVNLLVAFLRKSSKDGLYKGDAHASYKPRYKGIKASEKEVIYLTDSELKKIQAFTPQSYHQDSVRDMLLFCCFSGLRISDAINLSKKDCKDGYIHVVTKKTSHPLKIEVNRHTQAILDKRFAIPSDTVFDLYRTSEVNRCIKAIAKACHIDTPCHVVHFIGSKRVEKIVPKWALLSSHTGRRTFVVNALRLGIPAEVIMRWTGHSSYEAMKPYVKIVDELKKEQMSKFDTI